MLRRTSKTFSHCVGRQMGTSSIRFAKPYKLDTRPPSGNFASLWYLKPLPLYQTEKPYHINLPESAFPPSALHTNEESEEYDGIDIQSLRGRENDFTLDRNGFQVFGHPGAADIQTTALTTCLTDEDYHSPEVIRKKYYPAVIDFIKTSLKAELVLPFAHDVRRREAEFPRLPRGTGHAPQPVQGVHVDLTPRWAEKRLRMLLPDKADEVMKKRWQVLNIWRPLFGPVQDWPLALCDYTSLDPHNDLIASDNIYTHLVAETYNVFHRDYHRWYYLQDMRAEETLVFKSYESKADGSTAQVCVHAAFDDPSSPPNAKLRESIECLAIVVYPENSEGGNEDGLP